jgi:hypothetical protein
MLFQIFILQKTLGSVEMDCIWPNMIKWCQKILLYIMSSYVEFCVKA